MYIDKTMIENEVHLDKFRENVSCKKWLIIK
jgi:hypothetical protein